VRDTPGHLTGVNWGWSTAALGPSWDVGLVLDRFVPLLRVPISGLKIVAVAIGDPFSN